MAGGKSAACPAPPEAITGTSTAARTAAIISRSKPVVIPSASIEFSKISPTPRSTPRRAHSTASSPAAVPPPWVVTSNPDGCPGARRASTESTSTWLPNWRVISSITAGRRMAPVLMATLSAPARSSPSTSPTEPTPPPTVRGMKTVSAVRRTTSSVVSRPSAEAEMSRKVSSSAPSASYAAASSTGSPASRRLAKLTPLTTRPAWTSRQGMTRTATGTGLSLVTVVSSAAIARLKVVLLGVAR